MNPKKMELSEDLPIWKMYTWDFCVGGILSIFMGAHLEGNSSECYKEITYDYPWHDVNIPVIHEAIHAYSNPVEQIPLITLYVNNAVSNNFIVCQGIVPKQADCYGNGVNEIAAQKVEDLQPILIYIKKTLSETMKKEIIEGVCKHFNVKDIPVKYI